MNKEDISFVQGPWDVFLSEPVYVIPEKSLANSKVTEAVLPSPAKETPKPVVATPSLISVPTIPTVTNSYKLVIVVENHVKTEKSAKEMEFLQKLMQAVGLFPKDVKILSLNTTETVETKRVMVFCPSKEEVLSTKFTENFNQEPSTYVPFTCFHYTVLWSEPLEMIMDDVPKKKLLWSGLKTLFGLQS